MDKQKELKFRLIPFGTRNSYSVQYYKKVKNYFLLRLFKKYRYVWTDVWSFTYSCYHISPPSGVEKFFQCKESAEKWCKENNTLEKIEKFEESEYQEYLKRVKEYQEATKPRHNIYL